MKLHLISALLIASNMLCAQNTPNNNNSNLGVYSADMYYEEAEKEWKSTENAKEDIPAQAIASNTLQDIDSKIAKLNGTPDERYNYHFKNADKKKDIRYASIPNMIYFPEGFTMSIPNDKYYINRHNGKYTFSREDTQDENANFEVYVTDFDLQKSLAENNHFCVSKNRNLGLYIVYTIDRQTNTKDILGFRLFYTLPIDENTYVTVRSNLFNSYEQNRFYVHDVVNLHYGNVFYTNR